MQKFKSVLLAATTIAGVAISGAAVAQTYTPPAVVAGTPGTTGTGTATPFTFTEDGTNSSAAVQNYVYNTDTSTSPASLATPSLANNPFAEYAPGTPPSNIGGTASGYDNYNLASRQTFTGGQTYDGDFALHGAGASSVQNVLVRALNCFGTPMPLGTGSAGSSSISFRSAGSYKGTPAMSCNNGTFKSVTLPYTLTAAETTAGAFFLGTAVGGKQILFTPGTSVYEIQPQFNDNNNTDGNITAFGFSAKYVSTGSGFGRKIWSFGQDVFDDSHNVTLTGTTTSTGVPNPFFSVMGYNRWSHVQFGISDAPVSDADMTAYAANAGVKGGPAVQIPLFVLPVAIVYNTNYGVRPDGKAMFFNAKGNATYPTTTGTVNKVASLQLTGAIYCGIFNGMITNWNDPALTQANKNIPLYDPVNDSPTRWTAKGAPIRLVGRLDNSGTTDVFSRHLAQVCSQADIYGSSATSNYFTNSSYTTPLLPVADKKNFVPNKFTQAAENLPYTATAAGSGILDFSTVRSDTNYKPGAAQSKFAGSVNTVSNQYWSGQTVFSTANGNMTGIPTALDGKIGNSGLSSVAGGTAATPTGYAGSGLFILANGSGQVAAAISALPDYNPGDGYYFNGKIGYISPENVQPSVDASINALNGKLTSAILAVKPNSTTAVGGIYSYTYWSPTVKNALLAFNKADGTLAFLPPESDATGAFATETRGTLNGHLVKRSNPQSWTDVFYESASNTLAQPVSGYPMVGTTQFMTYTCFASDGNRAAVADLLGTLTSSLVYDSTFTLGKPTKINKNAFSSPSAALPGIISASNIGVLPAAWQKAIANTFLSATSDINDPTTGAYAATPLHLTSALVPTKVKLGGVTTYTPTTANDTICSSKAGM